MGMRRSFISTGTARPGTEWELSYILHVCIHVSITRSSTIIIMPHPYLAPWWLSSHILLLQTFQSGGPGSWWQIWQPLPPPGCVSPAHDGCWGRREDADTMYMYVHAHGWTDSIDAEQLQSVCASTCDGCSSSQPQCWQCSQTL